MNVGFLIASASRQAGGLFWSVRSLSRRLLDAGCEVAVFAGSDRYSDTDAALWGEVPVHFHTVIGPAAYGLMPDLGRRLRDMRLDLLHTHGLWMHPSVAALHWGRNKGRPWIVSPRGMLDSWALRNAGWKKRLAGVLYENRHLREAACLHALCDSEAKAMRAYGLSNPIAVIPNGVDLHGLPDAMPTPDWARGHSSATRVLLFMGRLHPKKGLVNLIQAWARAAPQGERAVWHLVIAGWDQNNHQTELERLIDLLDVRTTVHLIGAKLGHDKLAALARADAFVLPSFSEGLPMAVLEAWAHRLPVLVTAQCNLSEGFSAGAAVRIDPDVDSVASGLSRLFELSDDQLEAMGVRGRLLVETRFNWSSIAVQMRDVYSWVLGRGAQPECVVLD